MESKISSPIPIKDVTLLAYPPRKLSGPAPEPPANIRSDRNNRKKSTDSGRKASGNQTDVLPQVVQRKTSVSDLLSRLTMPTAASRSKMRDPARSPNSSSASNGARSPKISYPRQFSNPNDIPKPRAVASSVSLNSASRTPSNGSGISSSFNRKPPSPPIDVQKVRATNGKPRNGDIQSSSNGGPRSRQASSSSTSSLPGRQQHNSNSHSAGTNSNGNGKPTYRTASRNTSLDNSRRLSAPAPALNMTSPRDMSRAGHLPSPGTPSSFTAASFNRHSRITSASESDVAAGLLHKDLASSSTSLATSQTLSVDSEADLRHEIAQLREHNQSLRERNKQLKGRLDDALAAQDKISVELAVSEAGRNSLQQQVNGYITLQKGMEKKSEKTLKKLQRSQKLVSLLKFNIQDLKMTLEEKHLENYRLSRKLKDSGLEPLEIEDLKIGGGKDPYQREKTSAKQ